MKNYFRCVWVCCFCSRLMLAEGCKCLYMLVHTCTCNHRSKQSTIDYIAGKQIHTHTQITLIRGGLLLHEKCECILLFTNTVSTMSRYPQISRSVVSNLLEHGFFFVNQIETPQSLFFFINFHQSAITFKVLMNIVWKYN